MTPQDKQAFIRRIAQCNAADAEEGFILWSRHATLELVNEGWPRREVEEGMQLCEVIEDYPAQHRPLPDCLTLGKLRNGINFHVVVAVDVPNDRLFIITVYKPDEEEWENDWRTRKR